MVSYQTYFFVKGMTLWNTVCTWYNSITYHVSHFSSHVCNYFNDARHTYYFVKGYNLPLSSDYVKHTSSPFFEYEWKYHSAQHVLSHSSFPIESSASPYKIGWLSTHLVLKKDSHEVHHSIDDFLQKLTFYMDETESVSFYHLYQLWCIDQTFWVPPAHSIEFHVIDQYGEMNVYPILDTPLYLKVSGKWLITSNSENTDLSSSSL